MAKWADYLISGVWKSGGRITHVMAHPDKGESVGVGVKVSEAEVIKHLKQNVTFCTIRWNYSSPPNWTKGASVTFEVLYGRECLRTVRDATVADNLDNLIDMVSFPL